VSFHQTQTRTRTQWRTLTHTHTTHTAVNIHHTHGKRAYPPPPPPPTAQARTHAPRRARLHSHARTQACLSTHGIKLRSLRTGARRGLRSGPTSQSFAAAIKLLETVRHSRHTHIVHAVFNTLHIRQLCIRRHVRAVNDTHFVVGVNPVVDRGKKASPNIDKYDQLDSMPPRRRRSSSRTSTRHPFLR
jgi:hypothetical protein